VRVVQRVMYGYSLFIRGSSTLSSPPCGREFGSLHGLESPPAAWTLRVQRRGRLAHEQLERGHDAAFDIICSFAPRSNNMAGRI
jgi:hypothetical protein